MGHLAGLPSMVLQTEIPGGLIKTRIKKLKPPTFDKGCKVFTDATQLIQFLKKSKRIPNQIA
jgi:hypothetical protein